MSFFNGQKQVGLLAFFFGWLRRYCSWLRPVIRGGPRSCICVCAFEARNVSFVIDENKSVSWLAFRRLTTSNSW